MQGRGEENMQSSNTVNTIQKTLFKTIEEKREQIIQKTLEKNVEKTTEKILYATIEMKREHTILNTVENTREKTTEKTLTNSIMHTQKRVTRKHRDEPLILQRRLSIKHREELHTYQTLAQRGVSVELLEDSHMHTHNSQSLQRRLLPGIMSSLRSPSSSLLPSFCHLKPSHT